MKRFLLTGKAEEWNEIESKINSRNSHKYRNKSNRRGHGNDKPSYWTLGFKHVMDLMKPMTSEERVVYIDLHKKCCGALNVFRELQTLQWQMEYEQYYKMQGIQADEVDAYDLTERELFFPEDNSPTVQEDNNMEV